MLQALSEREWRAHLEDRGYFKIAMPLKVEHVPWFIGLCNKRYPPRSDKIRTEDWVRNRVLTNPATHLAERTERAVCITVLSTPIGYPNDWEAQVAIILADTGALWEAVKLLRMSKQWAHHKGCLSWSIANATDNDIGPLARRVGASLEPRWKITWRSS